jgi:hypothetical protein
MAKDAKGHGSDARGGAGAGAAHSQGVNAIGRQAQPQAGGQPQQQSDQAPPQAQLAPESGDSRELRMFADNDADLNRQSTQPIRDNLGKKMDKGVYNSSAATKLWGYHADRAAQSYAKQFGSPGQKWHEMFSPAVRREAAAHWEAAERDDIKSGASRSVKR